jgi:hypothetical protein
MQLDSERLEGVFLADGEMHNSWTLMNIDEKSNSIRHVA